MNTVYNLLIVDDSKVVRDGLKSIFDKDRRFKVVGKASNGKEALKAIEEIKPDVITLDITMPEMDGITTLKHLMISSPTPTIMMSNLASEGAEITFDALRFGAVDYIKKPSRLNEDCFDNQAADICARVEYAASVEVDLIRYIKLQTAKNDESANKRQQSCKKIVALGASEGGYSTLLKIIPHLEVDETAAYLVSLYVAQEYVDLYAEYLDKYSSLVVKSAEHDEVLKPGVCYLRSGTDYMSVHKQGDDLAIHINPAPFASRKGSIDMLFFSIAEVIGKNSIAVVLSGSGSDGTEGLEEISRVGGVSVIQDPKTCLSKEMSMSALNNKTDFIVSDFMIAEVINNACKK